MDMSNMMTIFDVVIGLLGIYLAFSGYKNYKSGEVDTMVVTPEEMIKCTDKKALSKYLMPKEAIFGLFCVLFGIQGLLNDTGILSFTQIVNGMFLVAFLVVWIVFSYYIRKAKSQYIQ